MLSNSCVSERGLGGGGRQKKVRSSSAILVFLSGVFKTRMFGNTCVPERGFEGGKNGHSSCSKLFFERRKYWAKLVLLSEIFRMQTLDNTLTRVLVFLSGVFRTQMLGNSCVPERDFQDANAGQY